MVGLPVEPGTEVRTGASTTISFGGNDRDGAIRDGRSGSVRRVSLGTSATKGPGAGGVIDSLGRTATRGPPARNVAPGSANGGRQPSPGPTTTSPRPRNAPPRNAPPGNPPPWNPPACNPLAEASGL